MFYLKQERTEKTKVKPKINSSKGDSAAPHFRCINLRKKCKKIKNKLNWILIFQSLTVILAFSAWEMTQLIIIIYFQLKQQCDDTSVQAYWIYYTCWCSCFRTLHLPSLQLKILSLNIPSTCKSDAASLPILAIIRSADRITVTSMMTTGDTLRRRLSSCW